MKIKREDLRPMSEVPMPEDGKEWGDKILVCTRSEWDESTGFHQVRMDKDGLMTTWFGCLDVSECEPLGWLPWPELEEE